MKAIFIDAENQEVKEVEINESSDVVKQYQKLVGGYVRPMPRFHDENMLLVDEDGNMKNYSYGFLYEEHGGVVGNGLIIGTNFSTGKERNTSLTAEEVKKNVRFLRKP